MIAKFPQSILLALVLFACAGYVQAQSADNTTSVLPETPRERERRRDGEPKSFREMMEKMRIEAEKKDYEAMLKRGDEALKISEQLEKSFELTARVSGKDLEKLESLEKLVKKIRGELGGSDDDGNLADISAETSERQPTPANPNTIVEGFKILKATTVKLVDELRKTTRFSISAAAIQSTNAVLRLARFLRIRN